AAGFAAVTAATYRAVTAIVELGSEFNDAYRTLQAGSGQTGEDLARLEQSFRNVFGTGADSMEDVANVMVELERRFDTFSNRRLERLTRQFLDLGGLVGEDAVGLVESLTGALNRFDVPAHMASDALDSLFRITQVTGLSLTTLGAQTENYGVGLQRLGFNLEEAAAFLALLDREGVAASRVFPSLNTAAGKLAREGVGDVAQGIADLIHDLRTLDEAAANARAVEMLGADYGNFLSVVRDANFDYQGLLATLEGSQVTITETAASTDGLREKWDTFKNYLKVTFEPAAMEVFDALTEMVDGLIPAVDRVKAAFDKEGLQGALAQVSEEWDRIYENNIKPLWEGFLQFLNDYVKPIALELGKEIGGAIASGIWSAITSALTPDFVDEFLDVEYQPPTTGPRSLEDIRRGLGLPVVPAPGGGRGTPGGQIIIPLPDADVIPMAAGGIVSSPTLALIGEAGPEAVVPLSEMGGMNGSTVNVYVNGGDPAAVVDAIRRYTRTNGPLGQVVTL
ncbi:MAG TPA: phage tail tape measure protein, partial [Acidimicrobiia bacterium]